MVQAADIEMAPSGQPLAGLWRRGCLRGSTAADVLCGLGAVPTSGNGRDLNGLLGCATALLIAAGLLVSCGERPPVMQAPPSAPAVALTPPDLAPPPPPATPIPRVKPKPPPLIVPAVVPPQRPAESGDGEMRRRANATAGSMDPAVLVGMTETETLQLLGQPAWTQEIPPAKTWQYASDRCVLRVFMFMEMTTQDFRTLSYELTSTDEQPDVDQQCLAELVAQAWGAGSHTDDAARAHRTGG